MASDVFMAREFSDRVKPLILRMNKIEDGLYRSVVEALRGAQKSAAYWNRVRASITATYKEMVAVFDSWAGREIPAAYLRSLREIQRRIATSNALSARARLGIDALLRSKATTQLASALYSDASGGFLSAALSGQADLVRFTRLTQQVLLEESVLNLDVAQGIELGNIRKAIGTISGRLSGKLVDAVEGRQFVRAGARRFKPTYYAELVARTKFHAAHTAAALATARNHGTDLVQVSSHNTTTPLCMDYEGKVYSVSGDDKRFPPLDNSPPYHPNCLHLIFPTFESGMEAQGTLEDFSAFSKGETSRPPVPASFVPVGQRSAE